MHEAVRDLGCGFTGDVYGLSIVPPKVDRRLLGLFG